MKFLKNLLGYVATLIFLMTIFGCAPSELDRAEQAFLMEYKDFKKKTKDLESTRDAVKIWERKLEASHNEYRRNIIHQEHYNLAVGGALGKGEALVAAKKSFDNPNYKSQINSDISVLSSDIEFARRRLIEYKRDLQGKYEDADKLLPALKQAFDRYEAQHSIDIQASGLRRPQSAETIRAINDVKEILADEQFRRFLKKQQISTNK